jgi:O-antigen/teichoic acid export membrane protein
MRPSSFLGSGIGVVCAHLSTLLSLPILARLYSPADFAPWAIGVAIVVFVASLSTLRYDLAIVSERDPEGGSALFWLAVFVAFAVFLCATCILLMLDRYLHLQNVGGVEMLSLWLFLTIANVPWTAWHLRHAKFWLISSTQIANALAMNLTQIYGGAINDGGPFWLVLGSVTGQLASFCIFFYSALRLVAHPVSIRAAMKLIPAFAWKHRRFVLFSLPYTLLVAIRDRLPVLVLGNWVTSHDIGLYSQAWRLSSVPAGITGSTIRPVLFHNAVERGIGALEEQIYWILRLLVTAGVPLLAALVLRSEDIFRVLLGEQWRPIGTYIAVLGFPSLAFALSNWMDRLLDVSGKQQLNLWTAFVCALTSTLVMILALAFGASLLTAVFAQSAILTLNYLFFVCLTFEIAGFSRRLLLKLLALASGLFLLSASLITLFWPSGTL